jgi:hypothetical protein
MRVDHLAIDGSVVSFEAESDLGAGATATGWVMTPSLMRSHPFATYPPKHSYIAERAIRSAFPNISVVAADEMGMKGGVLRVGQFRLPLATGGTRELVAGAWESEAGCMTTSLSGAPREALIEAFDTLQFTARRTGISIDSPVVAMPRPPQIIKEIPGLGVVSAQPAVASVLERVPRERGMVTNNGELFRVSTSSRALLFVSRSSVVDINPFERDDPEQALRAAGSLRVEWRVRRG